MTGEVDAQEGLGARFSELGRETMILLEFLRDSDLDLDWDKQGV